MDRRDFIGGASGIAAMQGVAHGAARGKLRVCVLGVSRAVMAADPIRWTAPLWLDGDRFELSVRLLAWKTWGPGHTHSGSFGEVPQEFMRPWADLSWMPADLAGVDLAIILADLWTESREAVAVEVITAARRLVPKSLTIALQPWHVVAGSLVPDDGPGVRKARTAVFAVSDGILRVQSNGAREELLALHADRALHRMERHDAERLSRKVLWAESDQLARPVIRMLAKASRAHFLPSHAASIG